MMHKRGVTEILPLAALLTAFVVVPLIFAPSGTAYTLVGTSAAFPDRGYLDILYEPIKEMAAILLLFSAALFAVWRRGPCRSGGSVFVTLMLVGVWVSALFSVNLFLALQQAVFLSALFSFPLFSYRLLDSNRLVRKATDALCLGGGLVAFYTLYRLVERRTLIGPVTGYERFFAGDMLGTPQRTALFLAALVPVFAYLATRRAKVGVAGVRFLILAATAGLTVLLSGERSTDALESVFEAGWVAPAAAAVGLFTAFAATVARILGLRERTRFLMRSIFVRMGVLAFLCVLFAVVAFLRYQNKPDVEVRLKAGQVVEDARKMLHENYLAGIGPGNWDIVFPYFHAATYDPAWVYRTPSPKPPDLYRVPLEWGLLGGIGFLGLVGWLLVCGLRGALRGRADAEDPGALAGGAAAIGLSTLVARPFSNVGTHALFWFLVGITFAAVAASRRPLGVRQRDDARIGSVRAVVIILSLAGLFALVAFVLLPDYAAGRYRIEGLCRMKMGIQANAAFQRALKLSPRRPEIHLDWTEYLYDQASAAFEKNRAMQIETGVMQGYRDKARAEMMKGATDLESEARKALRLMPNDASTLFGLGMAMEFMGPQSNEMFIAWERACRLSPATPAFHTALARAYITKNIPAKALDHWDAALEADPDNLTALEHKAEYLYSHSRLDEALDLYQQIRRLIRSGTRGTPSLLERIEGIMAKRFGEEELQQENQVDLLENRLHSLLVNIEKDPDNVELVYYAGLAAERLARMYRESGNPSRAEFLEAETLRFYREAAAKGHQGAAKKLIDKGVPIN
jgi:tetratricopeptide (TPR) repeat protein